MRRLLITLSIIAGAVLSVSAQKDTIVERKLVYASRPFFVPHWYIKAQGGAAYDVGEAIFSQLLSPAIQLVAGYQFDELWGLRGSLSGIWAKNRYAYPEAKYKWNFIQPSLEAEVELLPLFLGRNPERVASLFAFAGLGVAYSFNNDEAVEADKRYGIDFKKLWTGQRWNPVAKFGLGADYKVTENLSFGAEVNVNMLPDHFNSKLGRNDNRDWHFNALISLKYSIGKSHGRTEDVYEEIYHLPMPEPVKQEEFVDVPVEKISFNVNIHFLINQSVIRSNQIPKLSRLLQYLREHPKAFIRLSGYADKETGTPLINMRLSRERAQVVSQYLQDAGIQEWRIRRFAKGDKVQPFDIPEDNRVCICYVYDPDNPVPQAFDY
ncbi:MAG: OmpA family protein [Prevotella sp.]|nr:OmpA family protein [Prevotella sp.]MBQ9650092.1 OmpA family protein [Prevotella sp.]